MEKVEERTLTTAGQSGGIDLAVVANPTSTEAEAYRALRSTVKFADVQPPVRTLAIADAGTDGQHTLTAANLAAALAFGGDSVALVDADLRRPRVHEIFHLTNETGLGEWLAAGNIAQPLPLVESGIAGLVVVPAGHAPQLAGRSPADLLSSDSCGELFAQLRRDAAFVIVDMPSLAEFSDGLAIASRVDGILLMIRSGRTKRAAAQRAKESLDRVGGRVLGAVLVDGGGPWYRN